jgi:hypothetical protein
MAVASFYFSLKIKDIAKAGRMMTKSTNHLPKKNIDMLSRKV